MTCPRRMLLPFLLAGSPLLADAPSVTLHFQLHSTGAVSVTAFCRRQDLRLAPLMSEVIGCKGRMNGDEQAFGRFRCRDALRREGLTLSGVFDVSPIARYLDPSDEIEVTVEYPRLGVEEVSWFKTEHSGTRTLQHARIK